MPDKLIIFDYSGTLSLAAAAFSRPDSLMQHLQISGLFKLGVDSASLFWEIVNATWLEGSTTRRGYKRVMQERIAELFPEKAIVNQREISRAAGNFVEAYFDHSGIDENWRLILQQLWSDKSVDVVIATDHYAEATEAIIKNLGQWNIPAIPLSADVKRNFAVANSADLGMHKDQQQFWQTVQNVLWQNYSRVLLVDDFGQNEQEGDAYGNPVKVSERRKMTVQLLRTVFASDVESISFAVNDENISGSIADTSAIIDQLFCGGR